MDTSTNQASKIDVSGKIEEIKTYMPETYKSIKEKSKKIGNQAFVLVRRGLRGDANCFYAFESGRVVGTPFNLPEITAEVARWMVDFGCSHVVIWAGEGNV